MRTIYFCFGDFRTGNKEYQIFKVKSIGDAYDVADKLGYKIIFDNCLKESYIADLKERAIITILETIHQKLKGIENVVSYGRQRKWTECGKVRKRGC